MRIGILTGGGDAPGLNAAVRAVVRSATAAGNSVVGVRNGWSGLLGDGDVVEVGRPEVAGILQFGGTILGTSSRHNPLKSDGGCEQVVGNLRRHAIDTLVAIGGDGTLGIAAHFVERGEAVIGLPKTIDNDLSVTEYCIGFDSAVAVVAEALDRLHTTAASHHRVMVLEVMGRDTGWLGGVGGMAGGADMIVIPEVPVGPDEVVAHLEARRAAGSDFSIVVVSEGAQLPGLLPSTAEFGITDELGRAQISKRGVEERLAVLIESRTGWETRATVLGHTQRGGSPSAYDRVWATRLGAAAYTMAVEGDLGMVAVVRKGAIARAPIADVARQQSVSLDLYRLAQLFF
jgi:6-phosphofructokinase 1